MGALNFDYLKYILYALGFISLLYVALIILRHIILYYLIRSYKAIFLSKKEFDNQDQQDADATDREDELKRDQEAEIFKQEVQEIKNRINKKKSGDTVDVDVQRVTRTSGGVNDVFSGTESRLEMGKDAERIVGFVKPIGKWTNIVLGKELSKIASIMQHEKDVGKVSNNYWKRYVDARRQAENGVAI